MVDFRHDAGRSTEGRVGGAESHIETRRRISFLKKLGIENAAVEFGRRFRIGNGEADVLESGSIERQRSCAGGIGSQ